VNNATLQSISVTPSNTNVAAGLTVTYTATGHYSNGTNSDITSSVSWTSSNNSIAVINGSGVATGVTTGSVTITATMGAISGNTALTVNPANLLSISITPSAPSIAKGTTQQFTATGTYTDGQSRDITSSVTWQSGTTSVATITASGLAGGIATGSSNITATLSAITDTAVLTVTAATLTSISVTPSPASAAKGTTKQFTAIGTYTDTTTSDVTHIVTWSSSSASVESISNDAGSNGLATAVNTGSVTITASFSGASSGTSTFTVTAATLTSIAVTPATPSINQGSTLSMIATGTYSDNSTQVITADVDLTWSSSSTAVATISNASGTKGQVTAVATGGSNQTTTITATLGAISGNTVLTVLADTIHPTVLSAASLSTTTCQTYDAAYTNCVLVSFSEPVDATTATTVTNYKIAESISGTCAAASNFSSSTQTSDFSLSEVKAASGNSYVIKLSAGTQYKNYNLIASFNIKDQANNTMGCSNEAQFLGADNVRPYMLQTTNVNSSTIRVRYSEPMTNNTGTNADANRVANYTLARETNASTACTNNPAIQSVTKIDETESILNFV